MKRYRVIIADEALDQAAEHLRYLAVEKQEPLTAERWWNKALECVGTLTTLPHRCPIAPENEQSQNGLRMLIVDRCLFIYHVDEEDRVVRVIKFRSGYQLP